MSSLHNVIVFPKEKRILEREKGMKSGKGVGSIIIAVNIALESTPRSSPAPSQFSFSDCKKTNKKTKKKKKHLQPQCRGAIYSGHPSSVFRGGSVPGGSVQGERTRTGVMRQGVGGGGGGVGGSLAGPFTRQPAG